MDNGRYLCMAIPTIKRRDLNGYEKITTCKLCSYGDPKYLHHPLQLQHIYLHIDLHREGFTSNDLQNHYTSIFFSLVSIQKREFLFSRLRVFDRHHAGAPNLKDILFFYVFLTGLIGSVRSFVTENPMGIFCHSNTHVVQRSFPQFILRKY